MKEMMILMLTAVLVLLFVAVGTVLAAYLESDYPIIVTIISTGVTTFFGFLAHQIRAHPKTGINDSSMRIAITASLVITYFVFVGYTAFYDASTSGKSGNGVSDIARMAITSFTTIVGAAMVFYFGTSAYLQAKSTGTPKAQHENNDGRAT